MTMDLEAKTDDIKSESKPAVALDDIYDDDFAEEEDNVVLMREQLEALNIRNVEKGTEPQ